VYYNALVANPILSILGLMGVYLLLRFIFLF